MVGGSQWAPSHRYASQHEIAENDWKEAHVPFTRTESNPSTDRNQRDIPDFHDCSFALSFALFVDVWLIDVGFEITGNPLLCPKSN